MFNSTGCGTVLIRDYLCCNVDLVQYQYQLRMLLSDINYL